MAFAFSTPSSRIGLRKHAQASVFWFVAPCSCLHVLKALTEAKPHGLNCAAPRVTHDELAAVTSRLIQQTGTNRNKQEQRPRNLDENLFTSKVETATASVYRNSNRSAALTDPWAGTSRADCLGCNWRLRLWGILSLCYPCRPCCSRYFTILFMVKLLLVLVR